MGRTPGRKGSAVARVGLVVALVVAGLVAAAVGVVALSTRIQRGRLRAQWARTMGSEDGPAAAYADLETNEAALVVEELARTMGLTDEPGPATKAFEDVQWSLDDWSDAQVARPEADVQPPPGAVSDWLASQGVSLEALAIHVLTGDAPTWACHARQGVGAPAAPANGTLQDVVIAAALARAEQGNDAAALAMLDVSWRLDDALFARPEIEAQLAAGGLRRRELAVLRKLRSVPDAWRARIEQEDPQGRLRASLRWEAWRRVAMTSPPASQIERAAAASALATALSGAAESASPACEGDLAAVRTRVERGVPRWDEGAVATMSTCASALMGATRTDLQAELTRLALEAPGAASEVPTSACPDRKWRVANGDDGSRDIALSGTPWSSTSRADPPLAWRRSARP